MEVGGIAAEWIRDLESGSSITFLNAWRHYESDSAFDGDFTAYEGVGTTTDVELDQYSSELRLTSGGGETFDYQGGLYAYYSEFDSVGTFTQEEALVDNIRVVGDLSLGFFFPDGSINYDTNLYTTTSYAAFGQVIWNVTDDFSATRDCVTPTKRKSGKGHR